MCHLASVPVRAQNKCHSGNPSARQAWAVEQMHQAARASANLGLENHASFSGALAWPYVYPWPQRPPGLVETAFDELARRWRPILDAFDEAGVNVCYEIHPGEDLHDCLLYTSPSPRDGLLSRMPSSA